MKLPKELQNRKWAIEYLAELEQMSDEDLFEEAFDRQTPDDYDGGWTARGYWIALLTKVCLRERFLGQKNK